MTASSALLRAVRPRQWVKNVLVLVAPAAAGVILQPRAAAAVLVAFGAFSLAASGTYLVNDVVDVAADRLHPTKCRRPVACGELSTKEATVSAVLLLAAALIVAALVAWQLLVVIAIYETVQLWYCLGMKKEPVIELASVASGFLLRGIAGGAATHVALSQWFLLAAGFGALFVAAGKRYAELRLAQDTGLQVRPVLQGYTQSYLRFVWTLSAGALVTTYALWAFTIRQSTGNEWSVVSIIPFLLAVLRYAVAVDSGDAGEPEDIVIHDRMLALLGGIWGACLLGSVYL